MIETLCTIWNGILPMAMGAQSTPVGSLVLASSRRSNTYASPMFEIFFYSAVIAVAVILLIFVALKTRSWLLDVSTDTNTGEIFSISQLRELKDNGLISDEEYERAKRVLVAHGLQMLNSSSTDE